MNRSSTSILETTWIKVLYELRLKFFGGVYFKASLHDCGVTIENVLLKTLL